MDEKQEKQQKPSRPPMPLMGPPDPLSQWPLTGVPSSDPAWPGLMTPRSPDQPYEQWDPEELFALLQEFTGRLVALAGPFVVAAVFWVSFLMLSGRLRIH